MNGKLNHTNLRRLAAVTALIGLSLGSTAAVLAQDAADGGLRRMVRIPAVQKEAAPADDADTAKPDQGTRRALIVGIDEYDLAYGAGSLNGCVNDANDIRNTLLLGDPAQRWLAGNVQLLTDAQATESGIRGTLQSLASESTPGDVVVYYQASHGGQTSGTDTYLCTHDADYTDAELGVDLALFDPGVTVIVIVDACFSAGLFKDAGWPFAEQVIQTVQETKTAELEAQGLEIPKDLGANIAFMVACNYDETSAEIAGHGLYTTSVIEACSQATADTNGDGECQFLEIHEHATTQVVSLNSSQNAQSHNNVLLQTTTARRLDGEQPATPDDPPPSGDDEFEPNNTSLQAAAIQAGDHQLAGRDEDWFIFEVPTDGDFIITVDGPEGDLDLFMFDETGNLLAQSIEYGSYEWIWGAITSGTYLLAVAPYQGQGSSYLLTLDIPVATTEPPVPPVNPEPPVQDGPATHRALLVGIDHYDPAYGAGTLPSCINDANGMRDVLLGDTQGRWQAENSQVLTDGQATESAIRGALQNLAAQSGPNDVIVYFHSSHGGQYSGTDAFLCTYNADYTDAELGADLARFSAGQKVIVIVDACFSGGLFKDAGWPLAQRAMKTFKAAKTAQLKAKGAEIPKDLGANIAFMTACNYDQTCSAGAIYSLYTEYLIKACSQDSADANADGSYQFFEIYNYAAAEASNRNRSQTAQFHNQALLEGTIARTGKADGQQVTTSGGDDEFEPNDTASEAGFITEGQYNLVGQNEDWFDFYMPAGGRITVTIQGSEGDLDLFLFDPSGEKVAESFDYGSNEQVTFEGPSGTYTIAIAPYENQGGSYTLTVETSQVGGNQAAPPVVTVECGAGAGQAMAIGLFAMLGLAGQTRRWAYAVRSEADLKADGKEK